VYQNISMAWKMVCELNLVLPIKWFIGWFESKNANIIYNVEEKLTRDCIIVHFRYYTCNIEIQKVKYRKFWSNYETLRIKYRKSTRT